MSIQQQLDDALKAAMRAKQADTVACIRQLKSKVQEATNHPDFVGPVDDALYQQVISSYAKSLEKGITEFASAGERGAALVARYKNEIAYLAQYLPQKLGRDDTQKLVEKALKDLNITDPKQSGKVLGALAKTHHGLVDLALAKQIAEALLAG